jgi:nucleoside-triphosphatase
MHVFLTGQVQIGKSTVIQKTVSLLGLSVGGFRSGFGGDRGEPERWLYLWDAADAPAYDQDHGVVRFTAGGTQVFPDRFDRLGGGALHRARQGRAGLILMDECGRFEGQAARFQQEIFAALEENTPVLGVVRQGFSGWLDAIRSHPKVTLLTVTAENRDALPRQAAQLLRGEGER